MEVGGGQHAAGLAVGVGNDTVQHSVRHRFQAQGIPMIGVEIDAKLIGSDRNRAAGGDEQIVWAGRSDCVWARGKG